MPSKTTRVGPHVLRPATPVADPAHPARSGSRFQVGRIEKSPMPSGDSGVDWHRYVLENGCNSITGFRRGTLQQVTEHAQQLAQELNERHDSPRALRWTPGSAGRKR
ncbi:MAG: hypothetical protein B7Z66_07885 [Chromatiales bacterium 21-64-14]|nr:MAG: hypothetical protein B7Z66_07885 [Chromatiales bacterium 21-64-14]HQU15975.1 hypothetical protein [Gammaproteobacteria bacterium]